MVRRKGKRLSTSTGGDAGYDGDEGCSQWTLKAGDAPGFDYSRNCVIQADGANIPVEFLEAEAKRDIAVYGRLIPMDSIDFSSVRDSFFQRLEAFLKRQEPTLECPHGASCAEVGRTPGSDKKMDKHVERQSPSAGTKTASERLPQQRGEPGAVPLQRKCPAPPMQPTAEAATQCGETTCPASLLDIASVSTETESISAPSTRGTVSRGQWTGSDARSEQPSTVVEWQPGKLALFAQRSENGAQRFVTVQITTTQRAHGEGVFSSRDDQGRLAVTDGAKTFFAAEEELMELVVPSCLVDRLQSGVGASPSTPAAPTPQANDQDCWDWLTPSGLAQAESATVPLPRKVIPHLVGKGGNTIRLIEDTIGVIIGVMEGQEGQASVSLVGPAHRIATARPIIQAVAGGAWSLLHRIKERRHLFV